MLFIFGLSLSFIGSGILAFNSIKSRRQILKETSTGQVPVLSSARRKEVGFDKAMEEAKSKMPDVQAAIVQSTIAIIGFSLLTSGFTLQLISVTLPTVGS